MHHQDAGRLPAHSAPSHSPPADVSVGTVLGHLIGWVGEEGFEAAVLRELSPLVPAASWSVYRTGRRCVPTLFLSASLGVPDTTQDCWWAYLSGPYLHDGSWSRGAAGDAAARMGARTRLCHITAQQVGGEHQARVYDAYGVVERMSIVEFEDDATLFAVNVYRHRHQRPFSDAQLAAFKAIAPGLLALARKHIALTARRPAPVPASRIGQDDRPVGPLPYPPAALRERLLRVHAGLTARELDVCVRLLQGLTHEGIACDLGLTLPTVKTYRNRAFSRLGIHFRNELFALALKAQSPH
ncbi:helix-turn-helix transcriptional regulator [Pigmentiphaga litoralis]|uniref:helix-turn-helix transcriptional regulator n=1 Tax=Pigmentiphaga litoralis TaxID=516702 RepID=UPI003B42BA1F